MAIRYAVTTGVWSNTATWNGGTLPTSADDIFSNNFIVTVDQDITASSLRNVSNVSPAITSGGHFNVTGSTGTRTITLTGTTGTGGSTPSGVFSTASSLVGSALRVSSTSGATVNINTPLGQPQSAVGSTITMLGNATVNIAGIFNQPLGFTAHFRTEPSAANGTLNIIGNIIGSGGSSSGCLNIIAPGYIVNVTGNVTGGGDTGIQPQAAATINITGNVTAAGNFGIAWNGGSGGVLNITGNVTAAASAGINNNGTSQTITINGNVTASSSNNGIIANVFGTLVTVNGNLTNTSDYMAVLALKVRISPTTQQTWTYQTAGPNRQMFTANAFSGGTVPAASDVRLGVSYAGGSLSGTCAVPSANSVAFGVPVDNTTGNAVITRAQLFSDTGAIIAAYPQIN
jgi:hypothetical protein